ncbi:DNA-binding barrel domain superfamily [Sesbania bispinosa]|nr:DNA-binding barrel domain superfamily [Sesbania bispinosa]
MRRFKVVFRPTEDRLRIPQWFSMRWGDVLPEIIVLRDPIGNRFPVSIRKMGGRAYFTLGLDLLTRGYRSQLPTLIKFTLENPRCFRIRVYTHTLNEIDYPILNPC